MDRQATNFKKIVLMKKEYKSSTGVEVYIIYISLDHTQQSAILAILNKKEYLKDIS